MLALELDLVYALAECPQLVDQARFHSTAGAAGDHHAAVDSEHQGALRPDFKAEDLRLVFRSAGAVIEYDPSSRRRFVALLLDGLKAGR